MKRRRGSWFKRCGRLQGWLAGLILAALAVLLLCALAAALVGTKTDAAATADGRTLSLVIAPGQEAVVEDLFPTAAYKQPVVADFVLENLVIEYDRIRVEFQEIRTAQRRSVVLRPAQSVTEPFGVTRFFAVVRPDDSLATAVDRRLAQWVLSQVREREQRSPWTVPQRPVQRPVKSAADNTSVVHDSGAVPTLKSAEAFYVVWILPFLWLFFGLFTVVVLLHRRAALRRPETWWLAAMVVLALALRLWLPAFGPGDLKNTVKDAYFGVWPAVPGFDNVGMYGRGVEGLLVWLFRWLPAGDDTAAIVELLAGGISVALIYGLTCRLGFSRAVAWTAALLLAVSPLHVRFSPTVNRYILMVALLLAGWTLLLAYLQDRYGPDLVTALLALTLAGQCRPEGVVLPLVTVSLLWAGTSLPAPNQRFAASNEVCVRLDLARARQQMVRWPLVVGMFLYGLVLLIPTAALLHFVTADHPAATAAVDALRTFSHPDHNPFLSTEYTPLLWPILAVLGLLRGPHRILLWLSMTALLLTALLCGVSGGSGNLQLCTARYVLPAWPLYLILTAAGFDGLLRFGRWLWSAAGRKVWETTPTGWARGVATAALAALAAVPMPQVLRDTTMNQEYRFLRQALRLVPDHCTIVTFDTIKDHGLRTQDNLSITLGRRHRWLHSTNWPPPADQLLPDCVVFYQSGACAVSDDEPEEYRRAQVCRDLRRQAEGQPLLETKVSRVPVRNERYSVDPIPLGLYWLRQPARPTRL